jgi:hypothetical protein
MTFVMFKLVQSLGQERVTVTPDVFPRIVVVATLEHLLLEP